MSAASDPRDITERLRDPDDLSMEDCEEAASTIVRLRGEVGRLSDDVRIEREAREAAYKDAEGAEAREKVLREALDRLTMSALRIRNLLPRRESVDAKGWTHTSDLPEVVALDVALTAARALLSPSPASPEDESEIFREVDGGLA